MNWIFGIIINHNNLFIVNISSLCMEDTLGFKDKITLSEFNKLSLEERAQIALRNYFHEEVKIENDAGSLLHLEQYLEAWAYLEKNKYVNLVGGTPKSGAAYKITKKGLNFMDE